MLFFYVVRCNISVVFGLHIYQSVYMYIYWPSPQFTGPNAMLHFLMSYLLYIVILQYVCKTGNIIPGTGQTSVHTPIMLCRGRSRGGAHPARAPPKIGKNMIFWPKIVIFHTKYPKNVRASLRSHNFFKCAPPLTWNPRSTPVMYINIIIVC
jgi:hypothetical protein